MYFFWKTRLELHRPRKSEFKSEICTQYVDRFSQKGVVGVIWGWPNKRNIPKTNEFTNSTKVQNNSQPKVHQLDQLQQKINCQPKPQSPTVRPMCAITFTSLTLVVPPPRRTHGSRQVGSSGPAGGIRCSQSLESSGGSMGRWMAVQWHLRGLWGSTKTH